MNTIKLPWGTDQICNLFGHNKTIVDSNLNPTSNLKRWHVLLSYQRGREALSLHFTL